MKKVIRLTETDLVKIVKRVINEQTNQKEDASLKMIFDQVATIFNNQIKANPKLNQTQLTVLRRAIGDDDVVYRWMYGGKEEVPSWGDLSVTTNNLLTQGSPYIADLIKKTFNANYNKTLPDTLKGLSQGDFNKALNSWVTKYIPSKQKKQ
jgi:hypothetical protein